MTAERGPERSHCQAPERRGEVARWIERLSRNKRAQQKAAEVIGGVVARSERATSVVSKTRQMRLAAEASKGKERGWVYHTVKTAVEMIPGFPPFFYGPGDAVTLIEAFWGREIGGRRLDVVDRLISFAASAIPFIPATPLRELIRNVRRSVEDIVPEIAQRRQDQLRNRRAPEENSTIWP